MALTNAQRQARWKAKRVALARSHPDVIEAALLRDVERAKGGDLSAEEHAALYNKLADTANHYHGWAQRFARMAREVGPPPGWSPPGYRPPGR